MTQTLSSAHQSTKVHTADDVMLAKIGFRTRNLTLEEYQELTEEERQTFHEMAREENQAWVAEQFEKYDAAWLIVVDGQVHDYSRDLDEYPSDSEIMQIIDETGKFPFIFLDKGLLAIEEGAPWHPTVYEDDFYPTLNLELSDSDRTAGLELTADFDTGALGLFANLDRLTEENIVSVSPVDIPRITSHLNQQYAFVLKKALIRVVNLPDNRPEISKTIVCVRNWSESPFVRINPTREALAGRDIPRKAQVSVTLDFIQNSTAVDAPASPE